jgi:hypothetical protein
VADHQGGEREGRLTLTALAAFAFCPFRFPGKAGKLPLA